MRFVYIILTLAMISCMQKNELRKPVQDPSVILDSFQNFWSYYTTHIQLSSDFIGLDPSSNPIDKDEFLQNLITGNFLPVRLQSSQSTYYRLFKVDHWAEKDICNTIVDLAKVELANFEMENTLFPKFKFKDLNGVSYSNELLKGKTTVLKLWFIGCQQCIEEIPSLNQLVDSYKTQKDIVFLSLALDPDDALRRFLKGKKFDYATVGNQESFIKNQLGVTIYPTHIIIDKEGKIIKVVNSYQELDRALKQHS